MENGSSGSGFVVGSESSDKEAEAAAAVGARGGLGLKLQRTESFPYKMMTVHHRSQLGGGGGGGALGCGSGGGPTFYNGSNEEIRSIMTMGGIYDVVRDGDGAVVRTVQPFNTITASAFISSPGDMAASLGFPFTPAQWKELERQAMIYKYMMASVPVPTDLLLPATRNFSETAASYSNMARGSCFNLRFSDNTDPEPGRCRRTDGKKWRCSRDVAPDQKYCERHVHRGRPRSRKPVEVHAEINTINNNNTNKTPASASASATAILPNITALSHNLGSTDPFQQSLFHQPSDYKASPLETNVSAASYNEPRYMDWMMKGETVSMAASNQQWQGNASAFQQHYQEPLNLNSYTELGHDERPQNQQQNDHDCSLFLNPEMAPRRFIDAWSKDDSMDNSSNRSSVTSNGKLSLSSLALSMSGGKGITEDMEQIQMGLGIIDSYRDNGGGGSKSQTLSWMTPSPVSWMTSPPGGPLAEVLRTSNTVTTGGAIASPTTSKNSCGGGGGGGGGLNLMSDGWGGIGDVGSPRTTAVSSPSGVIQRTLASLSDSSGSSSPTFTAAAIAAKPDIVLQWLSQKKLESSS